VTERLSPSQVEKLTFGTFEYDRVTRQLLQYGSHVRLRPRELDILDVLVDRAGDFVSDAELMERVWRSQTVSEINLRVQMAGLQRVLEEEQGIAAHPRLARRPYIEFKQGAGYRFEVDLSTDQKICAPTSSSPKLHNLPPRRKQLHGRDQMLAHLQSVLTERRLVTLAAEGGTGKTEVALATAERQIASYPDGVWLVDLAGIADPLLVPDTIISAVGIPTVAAAPKVELINWLAGKTLLLILDNCEQLKDAVGHLVSDILREVGGACFLVTSRVPLNIADEVVVALPPLSVPPSVPVTPDIALTFPAVAFFIDSLRSHGRSVELDADTVKLIAEVSKSLNGHPLAIELAAAHMGLLYSPALNAKPDELTTIARESATIWRRQDTGLAALEWAYAGLSSSAQLLLARVSVCRREFTRATALAIAQDTILSDTDILASLDELANRSFITVSGSSVAPFYHMLVLVRDFAASKLQGDSAPNVILRRHAQNCLDQLRHSGADTQVTGAGASPDDIRAAVDWCFSEAGDALTGMRLVALNVGNRKKLYGIQEYARLLDKALARYAELHVTEPDLELRLIVERMCINQHASNDVDLMGKLNKRAVDLARASYANTGDPADLLAIHQNAFSLSFGDGNGPAKQRHAREMENLIQLNNFGPEIEILSARMSAQAHHFMGDHHLAVPIMQRVMAMTDAQVHRRVSVPGDRVDPRITLAIFNARSSWILGSPVKASAEAAQLVETVRANWDYVLCYVIAFAALPIALWRGKTSTARRYLNDLQTRASDFNLDYWSTWGNCYARAITFFESGRLSLSETTHLSKPNNIQTDMLATLHETFLTSLAVTRIKAGLVGWCAPEVLRAGADRAISAGSLTAMEGEAELLHALQIAEQQKALGWKVRIATSLGRLWRYQGKADQARALLDEMLGCFTEGFGDNDLVAANALRKDL